MKSLLLHFSQFFHGILRTEASALHHYLQQVLSRQLKQQFHAADENELYSLERKIIRLERRLMHLKRI